MPTYQRMWQYMSTQVPSVFVGDYDEGIARVRDSKSSYAFLLEQTANEYANTRKPCNTMKVGEKLNSVGYGVVTTFGFPLKSAFLLLSVHLNRKTFMLVLEN